MGIRDLKFSPDEVNTHCMSGRIHKLKHITEGGKEKGRETCIKGREKEEGRRKKRSSKEEEESRQRH